jgi:hypothetical protein
VLTDASTIEAFNILDPDSFVTCMFCMIALELDGQTYTEVTATVVGS